MTVTSIRAALAADPGLGAGNVLHKLIEHGAPLRLVTTVKYGIKSLKRIGRIIFTDERPRDFWAEQGYDWYAGL